MFCAETGRFALLHSNNWQHAAAYPTVILSGTTDLAGLWLHLPAGAEQARWPCVAPRNMTRGQKHL